MVRMPRPRNCRSISHRPSKTSFGSPAPRTTRSPSSAVPTCGALLARTVFQVKAGPSSSSAEYVVTSFIVEAGFSGRSAFSDSIGCTTERPGARRGATSSDTSPGSAAPTRWT